MIRNIAFTATLLCSGPALASSYDIVLVVDATTSMYGSSRIDQLRNVWPTWHQNNIVNNGNDAQYALVLVLGDGTCLLRQDLIDPTGFFAPGGAFNTFDEDTGGSAVNFAVALRDCASAVTYRPPRPRQLIVLTDTVVDDASTAAERNGAVAAARDGYAGSPVIALHVNSPALPQLPKLLELISRSSCDPNGDNLLYFTFTENNPQMLASLLAPLYDSQTWPCAAIYRDGFQPVAI
ncbi:MAG: hypothetical protein ABI451_06280 [Dokdonella sp.]